MAEAIDILLAKYVSGEATVAEREEAERWIAASPENEACYIKLYELWQVVLAATDKKLVDSKPAYETFLQTQNKSGLKPVQKIRWFWAAAVILLVATAGFFIMRKPAPAEYAISANKISKQVILPDSTIVWVNANSKITWDKGFGAGNRNVYLDGEGNFAINNRYAKVPFIVHTAHFSIRDIGTVFNIKDYSGSNEFEAFVVEGKIAIQNTGKNSTVLLSKNEVLTVAVPEKTIDHAVSITGENIRPISNLQEHLQWKEAALSFEEKSLPEILALLAEKYNVTISFDVAALEQYKYSGAFNSQMSITTILDIIKETTPVQYEKNGQTITVRRK